MARGIFVSYRRDDEPGTTGRIYDYLIREAGVRRDRIFLDVDNLVPGTNFVSEINRCVSTCEVFLAVIGKRWLEEHRSDAGERRIDRPSDFVRLEISAALSRSIPVIPILVDGARMPNEEDLPTNVRMLCQQHAIQVRNVHFERDIRPLVNAIRWHQRFSSRKEPPIVVPKEVAPARQNAFLVALLGRTKALLSALFEKSTSPATTASSLPTSASDRSEKSIKVRSSVEPGNRVAESKAKAAPTPTKDSAYTPTSPPAPDHSKKSAKSERTSKPAQPTSDSAEKVTRAQLKDKYKKERAKDQTRRPQGESSTIDQGDIANLGGLFYLAESGDPIYLYEIGTRFEQGYGVRKDLTVAQKYYQRSSRAGYVKAQRRLERLCRTRRYT